MGKPGVGELVIGVRGLAAVSAMRGQLWEVVRYKDDGTLVLVPLYPQRGIHMTVAGRGDVETWGVRTDVVA